MPDFKNISKKQSETLKQIKYNFIFEKEATDEISFPSRHKTTRIFRCWLLCDVLLFCCRSRVLSQVFWLISAVCFYGLGQRHNC